MLPTPSTSHVNYDRIYEPAEDSYLFLDTLSSASESEFLQARFPRSDPSPLALEIGTGSGVVLAFLTAHVSRIIGRSDVATLGIDVNEYAVAATAETVQKAVIDEKAQSAPASFLDCLLGDLTTAIKPGSIDLLIFNPPYVPSENLPDLPESSRASITDSFRRESHLLSLSTDGGLDGMETTNRLLDQLPDVLSDRGVAYVLFCAGNKPNEIIKRVQDWPCTKGRIWSAEKISSSGKKAGWEKLCVVRFCRQPSHESDKGST